MECSCNFTKGSLTICMVVNTFNWYTIRGGHPLRIDFWNLRKDMNLFACCAPACSVNTRIIRMVYKRSANSSLFDNNIEFWALFILCVDFYSQYISNDAIEMEVTRCCILFSLWLQFKLSHRRDIGLCITLFDNVPHCHLYPPVSVQDWPAPHRSAAHMIRCFTDERCEVGW